VLQGNQEILISQDFPGISLISVGFPGFPDPGLEILSNNNNNLILRRKKDFFAHIQAKNTQNIS
jgi:hypothetical protein